MDDYRHVFLIEPVLRRWTCCRTCPHEDSIRDVRETEEYTGDQVANGDSDCPNETAPPGTRTPNPLSKSQLTDRANPLQAQAPALTKPTESVLPVGLPDSAQDDPDSTLIVTSWEQLPAAVKTGNMAMVRAVEVR